MSLPTPKQELERKAIETLDGLVRAQSSGEITAREFYVATTSMCDVVSGLIDPEILTLISMARKELAA